MTDLIRNILKLDPFNRYTINQIIQHPWSSHSSTVCSSQAWSLHESTSMLKQHEKSVTESLLEAGFNNTVVEDMRLNHFGMRGTLWQMLLKSHTIGKPKVLLPNIIDDDTQNDDWISTFSYWFLSNHKPWNSAASPPVHTLTGAVQQHKFMRKTMSSISSSVVDEDLANEAKTKLNFNETGHPTFKPMCSTAANEEVITNTSSTCSSGADDEYDDDESSTSSSPATSVTDDDDDDDNENKNRSDIEDMNPVYPTVFHRISPKVKMKPGFLCLKMYLLTTLCS